LKVFVYLLDLFIPLNISSEEVMNSFEKDNLKPFELVKDVCGERIRRNQESQVLQ